MSETAKYRHLTTKYCAGNGLDIGAGGDPVVPWAISFDLPEQDYLRYNGGLYPAHPINWGGNCLDLPFKNETCDFVYSSHLLEDFENWENVLQEWTRVLKPLGFLIIILPDAGRWARAVAKGQPPNAAHKHESFPGELSAHINTLGGFKILEDRLTDLTPQDYSILFVAQKQ